MKRQTVLGTFLGARAARANVRDWPDDSGPRSRVPELHRITGRG